MDILLLLLLGDVGAIRCRGGGVGGTGRLGGRFGVERACGTKVGVPSRSSGLAGESTEGQNETLDVPVR